MTSPIDLVDAAAKLTQIFGAWPSFHDAEVLRVVLDRSGPDGPTLDAAIHVFEITAEVDAAGHYVLRHETLVVLRFHGINELEMTFFNHQNVLSEVGIYETDPRTHAGRGIAVALESCFGVGASFVCRRCEVVSAEPWRTDA